MKDISEVKKVEFSVLENAFFSRCAHKFIPSCDNPGTTGIGLWLTFTSIKMWNLFGIFIYLTSGVKRVNC